MSASNSVPTYLVADLGGTNSRVALAHGTNIATDSIRKYPNDGFACFEDILAKFLSETQAQVIDGVAVAVAGPVVDGRATLTNRDWDILPENLERATGCANIRIINDLQAQGYAVGLVDDDNLTPVLLAEEPHKGVNSLVIGVGTGFNIAQTLDQGETRIVPPAEAGHTSLPALGEEFASLAAFTARETGFASVEDILSGRGLERVFRWALQECGDGAPLSAAEIMAAAGNDKNDDAIKLTIRAFSHTMGAVAGDLALVTLPFSGLYLIGGLSRAMAPYLHTNGFTQAFTAKGRFSDFMRGFSVHVIEDDFAALVGTANSLARSS